MMSRHNLEELIDMAKHVLFYVVIIVWWVVLPTFGCIQIWELVK